MAISVLCEPNNIVQCVSGNKNVQTIHYFFTQFFALHYISEREKERIGSSTNNPCAQSANCKLQLGENLIDHNAQNAANLISAASDLLLN
jgi:hypothetical protein